MSGSIRLADLLAGLSMVADLGFSMPPGTSVRAAVVAAALGRRLDLPNSDVRDCFYTALLMHVGCVGVAHEAAAAFGDDLALNRAVGRTNFADPSDTEATLVPELTRGMPSADASRAAEFARTDGSKWGRQADVGVCEVARDTARRLGLSASTQQALYHVYESWRGGWAPDGLAGDDIDIASRVARASMDAALFGQLGGVDAAHRALQQRSGILLDPAVVDAFCSDAGEVMAEVDEHDPSDRLLVVEPDPFVEREPAQLRDVAAAFGDLADVKGPFLHGHSKTVAHFATGAARRLGLGDDDVRRVELAGLLQDVGRVGVSNAVWERTGALTKGDLEQVRMHAYYTERVLAASPTLAPIARIAGLHHERLDGTGYHRGCEAGAIPIEARLLAVADAFAAMTRERPHRPALAANEAADLIAEEAGRGLFDHDAVLAVLAEAGEAVDRPRPMLPGGLTQRECEVLTLLAEGGANPQIAQALGISRRTAEHHVQHIYAKIGVSTRAGAALFAVEHDLFRSHR